MCESGEGTRGKRSRQVPYGHPVHFADAEGLTAVNGPYLDSEAVSPQCTGDLTYVLLNASEVGEVRGAHERDSRQLRGCAEIHASAATARPA